jgi:hypothetical protein
MRRSGASPTCSRPGLTPAVPERVARRQPIHRSLFRWSRLVRRILAPPIRFDGTAELELHTLIGRKTLPLYLIAARSFHCHLPQARVVVHDDGTLRACDRLLLGTVARGVRVVGAAEAETHLERILGSWPTILRARRGNVRLRQLVDYCALASSDRILAADADVVLLRRPDAVLRWAAARVPEASVLYSPERDPKGPHWVPQLLPETRYVPDMCCGFACLQPSRFFDPDELEPLLQQLPAEVLGRQRFVTQMLYSLMAARPGQAARSLGALYESGRLSWLSDEPDRVICHYFASHGRNGAIQNLIEERELFERVLPPA